MESKNSILGKECTDKYYVYDLVGLNLHYVMDTEIGQIKFVCPRSSIVVNIIPLEFSCNYEQFIFLVQQLYMTSISMFGDGFIETSEFRETVASCKIANKVDFYNRLN